MGAGSTYAGAGLAGADIQASSPAAVPMANAAQYDPRLRIIVQNADGTVATVHPVDQTVAYCLTIKKGTISSDPARGFDWEKLRATAPAARARAAKDLVNLALAAPLAAGDVKILKVVLDQAPGRMGVSTTYINLRLYGSGSQTLAAAFNG